MSRWLVVGRPTALTHGGSLRAHYLFSSLVERTGALSIYRPDVAAIPSMARRPWALLPGTNVASAELLPAAALPLARRAMRLRVLDLHDVPVIHAAALGEALPPSAERGLRTLTRRNLEAFERIAVVSDGLADLAEVPPARRIVIGNGTDTTVIRPGPWPDAPTVGLVSGAAPGRGIETLIDAVRLARHDHPDLRLALCLGGDGPAAARYLANLRHRTTADAWVEIVTLPYLQVSEFMERASVLAVPHPPGPTWDVAPPVKLFDAMAAGRPVLSTPRRATAEVLRRTDSGVVSATDEPADVAEAILDLVRDPATARRLGANGRTAAETQFDWRILSDRLADAVLA